MADLKQMWAYYCHSFVLTTGLNGRWAKALVLSSRSVRAFEVPAEDVHRTGAHKPERATPVLFLPTAFSQINLFLASFFSTFSRENARSTFSVRVRIRSTIVTKRSKCDQNIKNIFLVSGFWWLICKTYFKFKLCGKIELKINWSVKTLLHRHKGGARSGYGVLTEPCCLCSRDF